MRCRTNGSTTDLQPASVAEKDRPERSTFAALELAACMAGEERQARVELVAMQTSKTKECYLEHQRSVAFQ